MEISELINAVPGLIVLKNTFCEAFVPQSVGCFFGQTQRLIWKLGTQKRCC